MPITKEHVSYANDRMLHNTNRALLLTPVNISEGAPRLHQFWREVGSGRYTWEQFFDLIRTKLAVHSFDEFTKKFQPCYYYRLRGAPTAANPDQPVDGGPTGQTSPTAEPVEAAGAA